MSALPRLVTEAELGTLPPADDATLEELEREAIDHDAPGTSLRFANLGPEEQQTALADAARFRLAADVSARQAGFADAAELEAVLARVPEFSALAIDVDDEPPAATATFRRASDIEPPADVDAWQIDGLLRPQSLLVMAAAESVGKTQAINELAIRAATGTGALFGHFGIPGRLTIAYVDEENGEAELYRREEQILAALGIERGALTRLHRVSFAGVHLGRPKRQTWLLEQLRPIMPDVVILDTAGAMIGDEWGGELKDAVRFLRSLIAELGCSIVLLVHLTKPPKDGRSNGRAAHGSALSDVLGQWARHADAVAILADLGADRVRLTVRKRVPPTSLVLAKRAGLWEVVAVTEEQGVATSIDDRILRAIAAGAATADEVRTALGTAERALAKRTFYDALARLRGDGLVEDGTPLRLTVTGEEAVA